MIYDMKGNADLDDLGKVVAECVNNLTPHLDRFDALIVQGISGVIVGVPVSLAIGKPIVILRKPDDQCNHSGNQKWINEGALFNGCRLLFLDDFISMGHTYIRVRREIRKHNKHFKAHQVEYVGDFTYSRMRLTWLGERSSLYDDCFEGPDIK